MASNNEEPAGDFEEPSLQQTPGAMLDTVAEAGQSLAEVDLGAVMPSGGPVASGKRASKLGIGGPGLGFGPGDGGVPASSAGASSITRDRRQTNMPASSMRSASSWPSSSAQPTPLSSPISPAHRRPNARAQAAATTGSISSGKAVAERSPTLPCSERPESRSAMTTSSSSIPPRPSDGWPNSRSDTKADSPARSASRGSRSCLVETATTFRSSPRRRSDSPHADQWPRIGALFSSALKRVLLRMATLEVHDGQGRVQFVELARDHPVLFGTSAHATSILEGEGIRPVHGRIRWNNKRFKLEASPDAEFVLINGTKMTTRASSKATRSRSAVAGSSCFESTTNQAAASPSKGSPEDARTRCCRLRAPQPDRSRRPESRSRAHKVAGPRDEPPTLETGDLLDSLEDQARGREASDSAPAPLSRGWSRGRGDPRPIAKPRPAAKPGGPGWIQRLLAASEKVAPGRERIASSPLVLGLVASLVILVGMGFWLKSIIASTVANRTFNHGVQDFEDGDYRTAIRDFDAFLATNPKDDRVGKASVLRAMANVRQYVSPDGATWTSALEAAEEMFDTVGQLEEFRDVRADLAELIIRVGEGLADRRAELGGPQGAGRGRIGGLAARPGRRRAGPGVPEPIAAAGQAGRGPGGRPEGPDSLRRLARDGPGA